MSLLFIYNVSISTSASKVSLWLTNLFPPESRRTVRICKSRFAFNVCKSTWEDSRICESAFASSFSSAGATEFNVVQEQNLSNLDPEITKTRGSTRSDHGNRPQRKIMKTVTQASGEQSDEGRRLKKDGRGANNTRNPLTLLSAHRRRPRSSAELG